MNPDPLRAEGTDEPPEDFGQQWYVLPHPDIDTIVDSIVKRYGRALDALGDEPHPDTPWLLLAAVIVFVALGILVAVKR